MKIGKISPTIWKRSVKKKVHIEQAESRFLCADASVSGNHAGIGYYAVVGAAGELASRKVLADGISVRILFPETMEEEELAAVCEEINRACERVGAKLTSLSAEGTAAVNSPVVYASAAGRADAANDSLYHTAVMPRDRTDSVNEGHAKKKGENRELILCGYAGLEGTLRILDEAEEELAQRFVGAFLMQAKDLRKQLVTPRQILSVADGEKTVIRQIGSGGILAVLWEMAEAEKIGFEIAMNAISLKQETVEICEYYRLNPYQMTSAGSYLILTDEADRVLDILEKAGARAIRLGAAKAQNARVIKSRDERRYLDRPAPDELARWHSEAAKKIKLPKRNHVEDDIETELSKVEFKIILI